MKKIDKKMLLFGILLCLLPMLIGFYYYDLLPDKIAIHFNMQGNPDNFVSKTFQTWNQLIHIIRFTTIRDKNNHINRLEHA